MITYLWDNLLLVITGWKDIHRLLAKPESGLQCGLQGVVQARNAVRGSG